MFNRFIKFLLPLLIVCILLFLASTYIYPKPHPTALPKVNEASLLTIYTSHQPEIYKPIIKEFEERTGIWVHVETAGTQELLNRIAAEANTPYCDVMFGGSAEALESSIAYFEPYKSPFIDTLSSESLYSPDYYWTGFSLLPQVFIFNPRLVSEREGPTTWQSLTDPKWYRRIAFADPYHSSSSYTALATLVQLYGEEGWELLPQFIANLGGTYLPCSSDVVTQVDNGTCPIGITLESTAKEAMSNHLSVGYIYPMDGTSCVPDGTALIKNAPHAENAKRFIDFTLCQDTQTLLSQALHRRPVRKNTPPNGTPTADGMSLIPYDIHQALKDREEILKYIGDSLK